MTKKMENKNLFHEDMFAVIYLQEYIHTEWVNHWVIISRNLMMILTRWIMLRLTIFLNLIHVHLTEMEAMQLKQVMFQIDAQTGTCNFKI